MVIRLSCAVLVFCAGAAVVACIEPPPQGPTELTYQNGYAQTMPQQQNGYAQPQSPYAQPIQQRQNVTYAPTAEDVPVATSSTIQTQPVPLETQTQQPQGVAVQPLPSGGVVGGPATMAVPNNGAIMCTSDTQCLLGRCNTLYGRCAFPCRNTAVDCKAGNVCTAQGLCVPQAVGGVKM